MINLGLYGIEVSAEELQELARKVLQVYPLRRLVSIPVIFASPIPRSSGNDWRESIINFLDEDTKRNEERRAMKKEGNLDYIAEVEKDSYQPIHIPEAKAIFTDTNPSTLAHELGHALGLRHPSEKCGKGCKDYYKKCPYNRMLMGCHLVAKNPRFSLGNLKILLGGK